MTFATLSPRRRRAVRFADPPLADRGWTVLAIAVALAASLGFGLVAGVSPKYAIVGVLAIGFVALVIRDIVAAFGVFAAITFLEQLSSGSTASVAKLAGLLILVAWLVKTTSESRGRHIAALRENQTLFVWITLYLVLNIVSAAWSTSSGAAISQTYRYTLDALLVPIVYSIVDTPRDLVKIIVGYLFGAGLSTIYGLVHPVAGIAHQTGRLTGSFGDANSLATMLVAAMTLCAGLWLYSRRSPRLRLFLIAVVALTIIGLVGSLSRSGLLAFAVVLLLATVIGGRARKAAIWACIVVLVAAPTYFVFFAGQRAHRVDSTQSSGRNDIWLVAERAWEAHPLLGVGAGNFEVVSHDYIERPGLLTNGAFFVYDTKVVHNIYLEQLTTLGPLGLILLLGAFATLLRTGMRTAHIFERLGDAELELLARFWVLALMAFLTADFFLSELVDKQLWIVIGLGLGLHKLARLEQARVGERAARPDAAPARLAR